MDYKEKLKIALIILGGIALASFAVTASLYGVNNFSFLYSRALRSPFELGIDFQFTQEQFQRISYFLNNQFATDITTTVDHYNDINVMSTYIDTYSYFKLNQIGLSEKQLSLLAEYSSRNQSSVLLWGGLVTGILVAACAVAGIMILIAQKKTLCSAVDRNEANSHRIDITFPYLLIKNQHSKNIS